MFIMYVAPPHLSCHITPLVAIAGYVAYPKQLRINPTLLYFLSVIHNGLLVAFSAWTFISLSKILHNDGIVFQSNYYFQNPQFDTVIYCFYISKYYEFFDTFLLYLNGKSPIFLQKYHHIGAVICWHLLYMYKVDGIWLATIANSFVHTIMYSYYFGCLLKINQVRFIKKYITSLQLIQLFIPNFIELYYYAPPIETTFNYSLIKFFVGYVSILVVLFSQFYYTNYIKSKHE
jgi:hypothetical protein